MPCTVSKEEEEFYEKRSNEKLFGVSDLTIRITERVACELARIIEEAGLQDKLSPVATKWIIKHKEEDARRGENS